jgi:hypothetical protein
MVIILKPDRLPVQARKEPGFTSHFPLRQSNPVSPRDALTILSVVWNRFPLAKIPSLAHRHDMESHELLREIFEKKTPKEVSADLELSTSMIYKWAQPPGNAAGSGIENPLDRIEALMQSTGDQRLVQWICQRAGGFFILNPKNMPHPHFLIPATNEIVQEFADLLAVIATAAADNQITPAEAKQIRARWEELKTATEGFVACCEEGNFGPLEKNIRKS